MGQERPAHDAAILEVDAASADMIAIERAAVRDDTAVDKARLLDPDAPAESLIAGVIAPIEVRRDGQVVETRVCMRQLEDRALRPRGRQRLHQLHDRLRPGRRARDRRAVGDDDLLRHLIGAVEEQRADG